MIRWSKFRKYIPNSVTYKSLYRQGNASINSNYLFSRTVQFSISISYRTSRSQKTGEYTKHRVYARSHRCRKQDRSVKTHRDKGECGLRRNSDDNELETYQRPIHTENFSHLGSHIEANAHVKFEEVHTHTPYSPSALAH